MQSIVSQCEVLFGEPFSSCTELLREFKGILHASKEQMPSVDKLIRFINDDQCQDDWSLSIQADGDNVFISKDTPLWEDEYPGLMSTIIENDIKVTLKIEKEVHNGCLYIYKYKSFVDFLSERTNNQLMQVFTQLFEICGDSISIVLLDKVGTIQTNSITISDQIHNTITPVVPRHIQRKWCNESSIFFDQSKYPIIPQDFIIKENVVDAGLEEMLSILSRMKCILSYIYVAGSSSIQGDTALLNFNPSQSGNVYNLAELTQNDYIVRIYEWIYSDERCTDRAAIARNIIGVYCKDKETYLNIDERVFSSIISDYQIYQKSHVEQYIDMKNKISDHIVECAKQIQELSHDFSDALRNNLVAILIFLMTVFLTDVYDTEKLLSGDISFSFIIICWLLIVISIIYMVVSILSTSEKWKWLNESYFDLKNNYREIFVPNDIEEAFSQDQPMNNAKKKLRSFMQKICLIWSITLVMMCIATGSLTFQYAQNLEVTSEQQVDGYIDLGTEIALPINNQDPPTPTTIPDVPSDDNAVSDDLLEEGAQS